MEDDVGRLGDERVAIAGDGGDRGLDRLLAELLRAARDARVQQRDDVRAFRALDRAFGDRPPERRREARARSGVAHGAGRAHAQKQCVAVAVVANLLDRFLFPGYLQGFAAAYPDARVARGNLHALA